MKPFKLDNEPKIASGFRVPDNYFDNFSTTLMDKLPVEAIEKESKVISLFRKKKTVLFSVAAVFTISLMIPIAYQSATKIKELDSITIENYLAEQGQLNQYDLIGDLEPESNIIISNTKEIETQTLEDVLVSNPNLENLVIEN
jgi:hypothetical protein